MTEPIDLRAEIERILAEGAAAAKAAIDASVERARTLLAEQSGPDLSASPIPDWITLGQAAGIRHCTEQTMQRHVIAYGLGVKAGGRWRVDRRRLDAWQRGAPYEPLDALAED